MFFQPASYLPFTLPQFFNYKLLYTTLDTQLIRMYSKYMKKITIEDGTRFLPFFTKIDKEGVQKTYRSKKIYGAIDTDSRYFAQTKEQFMEHMSYEIMQLTSAMLKLAEENWEEQNA